MLAFLKNFFSAIREFFSVYDNDYGDELEPELADWLDGKD